MNSGANTSHSNFHFTGIPSSNDNMSGNENNTLPVLSEQGFKLGKGYGSRTSRPGSPTLAANQQEAVPLSAGAGNVVDEADSLAAAALQAGYKYRLPVPSPVDDDVALEAQEANMASALNELEDGLAAAANGPPHIGDDAGGDGGPDEGAGDEDDEGLYTAHSSSLSGCSSLDTEAVIAFAMDWEDEDGDGAGGPEDRGTWPT